MEVASAGMATYGNSFEQTIGLVIQVLEYIYAGKPLELLVPKCENLIDWAISREFFIIFKNDKIALNDYPIWE